MSWAIKKIIQSIRRKLSHHEKGLYVVLILPISFASLLTFISARLMTIYHPEFYIEWSEGLHVHHFAYGLIVLGVSNFLSLVFSGPRAKFWISLLYGTGLGLAFDEFAMWIKLQDDEITRWEYDGIIILFSTFLLLVTLLPGIKFIIHHWPFSKKEIQEEQKEAVKLNWKKEKPHKKADN